MAMKSVSGVKPPPLRGGGFFFYPVVMFYMLLPSGDPVRAVGKTKEAGIGLTIDGLLNILLDPVFIFHFHMDVAGAAFATMLSNTVSAVYFLVILVKLGKEGVLTIAPKHFSLEKKVAWGTVSVGLPAALSVLLVCFSISLLNGRLLAHEGGNILSAAYGVASKCGTIALHISIDIAQGVMPLIGYNYGAKNYKRVHAVCRLSFMILLIFSVLFLAAVQLFPEQTVKLFIDHDETVRVGGDFIRCWSWCVVGMSLFNMYNSIFQAVGKWQTSLLLAVLRLGVIFSALTLLFDALFGVRGLMWVQAVTDTLSCILAFFLYEQFKRSVMQEISDVSEVPAAVIGNRIITISREFGSGGHTIGRQVAEVLGIPCYDSEIIEKIAEESGFAREYVASNDERVSVANLYDNTVGAMTDKMWFAQKKVITELAGQGACVIVADARIISCEKVRTA